MTSYPHQIPPKVRDVLVKHLAEVLAAEGEDLDSVPALFERSLTATPESLRAEWLRFHLERSLGILRDVETKEPLSRLVEALCGEAERPTTGVVTTRSDS